MNYFFGLFKEKIVEAKQQNQQEIQALVNAFEGTDTYSSQRMLSYLQQIKTNYMEWSIMIANEASTGLYYSQIHNKNTILKKIKEEKQTNSHLEKNDIVLDQMNKTLKELKQIGNLNNNWCFDINHKINEMEIILKSEKEEEIRKKLKWERIEQKQKQNVKQNDKSPITEKEQDNSDKN